MPAADRQESPKPPPLHERIYQALRDEVICGQRKPGELISMDMLQRASVDESG